MMYRIQFVPMYCKPCRYLLFAPLCKKCIVCFNTQSFILQSKCEFYLTISCQEGIKAISPHFKSTLQIMPFFPLYLSGNLPCAVKSMTILWQNLYCIFFLTKNTRLFMKRKVVLTTKAWPTPPLPPGKALVVENCPLLKRVLEMFLSLALDGLILLLVRINHLQFWQAVILHNKNDWFVRFITDNLLQDFIPTIKLGNLVLFSYMHLQTTAGLYGVITLVTPKCACTKVILLFKSHILWVFDICHDRNFSRFVQCFILKFWFGIQNQLSQHLAGSPPPRKALGA